MYNSAYVVPGAIALTILMTVLSVIVVKRLYWHYLVSEGKKWRLGPGFNSFGQGLNGNFRLPRHDQDMLQGSDLETMAVILRFTKGKEGKYLMVFSAKGLRFVGAYSREKAALLGKLSFPAVQVRLQGKSAEIRSLQSALASDD